MKSNEHNLYILSKNGGYSIDKRTKEGKSLIKHIIEMDINNMLLTSNNYGIAKELTGLRIIDLELFFGKTFSLENINFN